MLHLIIFYISYSIFQCCFTLSWAEQLSDQWDKRHGRCWENVDQMNNLKSLNGKNNQTLKPNNQTKEPTCRRRDGSALQQIRRLVAFASLVRTTEPQLSQRPPEHPIFESNLWIKSLNLIFESDLWIQSLDPDFESNLWTTSCQTSDLLSELDVERCQTWVPPVAMALYEPPV